MTIRYVDPAAAGTNDGTSWTNAWTNIQSAFDTAIALDIVYCRGTQVLSALIDLDTQRGSNTTGFISFIGTNSSGVVDGTRFVLDANSAVANCLKLNNADYYYLENFEFKNATAAGVTGVTSNSSATVWNNCSFHNNGTHGFDTGITIVNSLCIRCVAYSNTSNGFNATGGQNKFFFCRSRDNTGDGFNISSTNTGAVLIGCIADHNGDDGIDLGGSGDRHVVFNCVIDANADDGLVISSSGLELQGIVIGNRITRHNGAADIGFNAGSHAMVEGWNYFQDNDGANIQNATYVINLGYNGSSSSLADLGDIESGYVDQDNPEDYNLATGASLRRSAITIPTT